MKLSIVIPVYRTESTLHRCVKSVLDQDYPDLEVILVDDESPDRCPALCDEWAASDQRVRVIHKKNGGLSDARNAGIAQATGEYITFVDSDDYISRHTYAPIIDRLERSPEIDILEYPIYVHYGSSLQYKLTFQSEATYHDLRSYWLDGQAYQHTYACNKVFRRSLFSDVNFPIGMVFEDAHTLPLLLRRAKVVQTFRQGLYYYCSNSQGITQTADGHALRMLLEPHAQIINDLESGDKAFQIYYLHVVNIQIDVCELTGEAPILPRFRLDASCFRGTQKLKAITLNMLGLRKLCTICKYIHKIWKNR